MGVLVDSRAFFVAGAVDASSRTPLARPGVIFSCRADSGLAKAEVQFQGWVPQVRRGVYHFQLKINGVPFGRVERKVMDAPGRSGNQYYTWTGSGAVDLARWLLARPGPWRFSNGHLSFTVRPGHEAEHRRILARLADCGAL